MIFCRQNLNLKKIFFFINYLIQYLHLSLIHINFQYSKLQVKKESYFDNLIIFVITEYNSPTFYFPHYEINFSLQILLLIFSSLFIYIISFYFFFINFISYSILQIPLYSLYHYNNLNSILNTIIILIQNYCYAFNPLIIDFIRFFQNYFNH